MKQKSWKKSEIKPYKLVLILGLIVLGIITGKYIIQAVSPPSWTDSTITAGETLIRKVHMDELRSEINANRADVGLATTTWTDSTITAGQTLIRAVHFSEARTALEGIFTKIEDSLPSWTNATITPGTTIIRKTHLDEARASTTVAYDSINAKKCCGSYGGSDTGSAGACPGTDDSACGTIDCSGWYVQTGTEGVEDTEYCYNKQDITSSRCEDLDDCKDANTSDCDPQTNDAEQYSCELCKYIHDTNACYQTTLGSCTNYASYTNCGTNQACSGGSCVSWWNGNWQYHKKLTFSNNAYEAFSDFPVSVHLKDGGGSGTIDVDFAEIKANGADIRFVDDNDATELKYEIEKWDDTTEEAWIWVKVPTLAKSDTDFIYMYWGYADASDNQDAQNVWDSNHVMVQHLEETSGTHYDSTSYGNNGIPSVTIQGSATGKIDGADDFDGLDDKVEVPQSSTFEFQTFTLSTWVRLESEVRQALVTYGLGTELGAPDSSTESFVMCYNDSFDTFRLRLKESSAASFIDLYPPDEAPPSAILNKWVHVSATWDGSEANLYMNSTLIGSAEGSGTINYVSDPNSKLRIGNWFGNDERYLNGITDEVRISNTPRSANWIAAQYKSMTDAYITAGSKEVL